MGDSPTQECESEYHGGASGMAAFTLPAMRAAWGGSLFRYQPFMIPKGDFETGCVGAGGFKAKNSYEPELVKVFFCFFSYVLPHTSELGLFLRHPSGGGKCESPLFTF